MLTSTLSVSAFLLDGVCYQHSLGVELVPPVEKNLLDSFNVTHMHIGLVS
jgi:hypothetical protein